MAALPLVVLFVGLTPVEMGGKEVFYIIIWFDIEMRGSTGTVLGCGTVM